MVAHQQNGVRSMCDWCNKNAERNTGESYAGDGAEYRIEYDKEGDAYLNVVAYAQCGYDAGEANIYLNYCPWCGRKLRG